MRKMKFVLVFFICLFMACNNKVELELQFADEEIEITVGSQIDINPIIKENNVIITNLLVEYSIEDEKIISIENGVIKALQVGKTVINANIKDNKKIQAKLVVNVVKEELKSIKINCEKQVFAGDVVELSIEVEPANYDISQLVVLSDNEEIATISKTTSLWQVNAKKVGKCNITASLEGISDTFEIEVIKKLVYVTDITIENISDLIEGDTYQMKVSVEPQENDDTILFSSSNTSVATISEDGLISAVGIGSCIIRVSSENSEVIKNINLTVNKKEVLVNQCIIECDKEIFVGEEKEIKVTLLPIDADNLGYAIESNNVEILKVVGRVMVGVSTGVCEVIVKSNDGAVEERISIEVIKKKVLIEKIEITGEVTLQYGFTTSLSVEVFPKDADDQTYTLSSSDDSIATVSNEGVVTPVKSGVVTIYAKANDGGNAVGTIEITIIYDTTPPVIYVGEETVKDLEINYNEKFDPLKGVYATDDTDGDITSEIKYTGSINNRLLGEYKYTYTVSDSNDNKTEFVRNIKVVWNYGVKFIGHGGCYSGLMNSEQAFRNAILVHGYQLLECDLRQTSDGVFILCHDENFNGINFSAKTWDEVKDEVYTATRGGISYTTKLCTLDKYLDICKQFNVAPVLHLQSSKGINNNDQSRMQSLMDAIEKKGLLNEVILLASTYNCLIWTRNNGYEYVKCQYLVNSCESETFLNRCIDNDLDLSFNIAYDNSDEWIARYKDAGLEVSSYTFNQYTTKEDLQSWINRGVDYVTVDVTKPYEVTLPDKIDDTATKYKVTFKDYDGTIIKESMTAEGKKAVSPVDPKRLGYTFTGWDKSYSNITSDLVVTALYSITTYSIVYEKNTSTITEKKWNSKEEFLQEFYTDMFNWFSANVDKISELTLTNGTYKMVKNSKTATWKNVAELRAIDKYIFEASIGTYIYKPFTRSVNEAIDPVVDNNYFLNTEPYRTEYRALDGYFLNAMNTSYKAYDIGYGLSGGVKVQIFFRFQQWAMGEFGIPVFNNLPVKYEISGLMGVENVVVPEKGSYTIKDNLTFADATSTNATFLGWFLEPECTNKVTGIKEGTTENIVVYAKWKLN